VLHYNAKRTPTPTPCLTVSRLLVPWDLVLLLAPSRRAATVSRPPASPPCSMMFANELISFCLAPSKQPRQLPPHSSDPATTLLRSDPTRLNLLFAPIDSLCLSDQVRRCYLCTNPCRGVISRLSLPVIVLSLSLRLCGPINDAAALGKYILPKYCCLWVLTIACLLVACYLLLRRSASCALAPASLFRSSGSNRVLLRSIARAFWIQASFSSSSSSS